MLELDASSGCGLAEPRSINHPLRARPLAARIYAYIAKLLNICAPCASLAFLETCGLGSLLIWPSGSSTPSALDATLCRRGRYPGSGGEDDSPAYLLIRGHASLVRDRRSEGSRTACGYRLAPLEALAGSNALQTGRLRRKPTS